METKVRDFKTTLNANCCFFFHISCLAQLMEVELCKVICDLMA